MLGTILPVQSHSRKVATRPRVGLLKAGFCTRTLQVTPPPPIAYLSGERGYQFLRVIPDIRTNLGIIEQKTLFGTPCV